MKKIILFVAAMCCSVGLMASTVHVSDLSQLTAEIGAGGVADTIVVDEDIDVTMVLTQVGSKVLDLNGHTLSAHYQILLVGDLTVTGEGQIIGDAAMNNYLFFVNSGSNLTIQNGTFDMSQNAQRIIFVNEQDEANTAHATVTINGGLFISGNISVMHMQCRSAGTHSGVINGGVFVHKHSYLGAFSDSGINKMALTLNKCVLINAEPTNNNVAYMYSTDAQYIIPAGKKYVLDGQSTGVAEATSFNNLHAKVCYVGDDSYSEFMGFNLIANNARANVYNVPTGGAAYGHLAHTAVVVTATPADGFPKLEFTTTPAHDVTARLIAADTYLIMPYVGGESINITGSQPTSLYDVVSSSVSKRIVGGQLLIERDGRTYNVMGQKQ